MMQNSTFGTRAAIGSSFNTGIDEFSITLSESISFKVYYMGKLRLSYRSAPSSFVDDALDKFAYIESDRWHKGESEHREENRCNSLQVKNSLDPKENSPNTNYTSNDEPQSPESNHPLKLEVQVPNCPNEDVGFDTSSPLSTNRRRTASGDSATAARVTPQADQMRIRALSIDQSTSISRPFDSSLSTLPSYNNRGMLLQADRNKMRVISTDGKIILLNKLTRNILQLTPGLKNTDCFGLICSEGVSNNLYVAYIFRCMSSLEAADIISVLKTNQNSSQDERRKDLQTKSCEHCPLLWYSRLYNQVKEMTCEDDIEMTLLKKVNTLSEEDRVIIFRKFKDYGSRTIRERNELFMSLIRWHCESQQSKHIHDHDVDEGENRDEFLDQHVGLRGSVPMLMKAKRSITNSFDQLMKRKGRDNDGQTETIKEETNEKQQIKVNQSCVQQNEDIEKDSKGENNEHFRQRSWTVGSGSLITDKIRNRRRILNQTVNNGNMQLENDLKTTSSGSTLFQSPKTSNQNVPKQSPIINIFSKVGHRSGADDDSQQLRQGRSWRHAMFKRVISPNVSPCNRTNCSSNICDSLPVSPTIKQKRTREDIRQLWRTAIRQQILLIRMEKQNINLKKKQNEVNIKRSKLTYLELGVCCENAEETWESLIKQAAVSQTKLDIEILNSAVLKGIPKHKRGQVWQLFAQQWNLRKTSSATKPANESIIYENLLRQHTSQQHAILIDLGRTFPSHPYFSVALGSGQLALFNLLKAYSILDSDVNYCQGLSFVAGILLLHVRNLYPFWGHFSMEEEEAFNVLKHVMFDLGAREQYKPDMLGLQVKLYQLTRLIHDHDSDIHFLLHHNDVLPSLYAAPWILTMFASQFPLGFAVRVFDVMMLQGVDALVKFAVTLILDHKKELLKCKCLESIMQCFKRIVTNVNTNKIDTYLQKVMEMDSEKQLLTYSIEYSVMNDENFHNFSHDVSTNLSASLFPSSKINRGRVRGSVDSNIPLCETESFLHQQRNNESPSKEFYVTYLEAENRNLRNDIESLLRISISKPQITEICPSTLLPLEVKRMAIKYLHVTDTEFLNGCEKDRNLQKNVPKEPLGNGNLKLANPR